MRTIAIRVLYFRGRECQLSLRPVIGVISRAATAHALGNAVKTTEKTTPAS